MSTTPDALIVRKMTAADLPGVVALHLRSFTAEESYAVALGPRFVSKSYEFFLHDPKAFAFVAIYQGTVVGIVNGTLESAYGPGLRRYTVKAAALAFLTHPKLWLDKRVRTRAGKIFHRNFIDRRPLGQNMAVPRPPSTRDTHTSCLAYFALHADYANLRIGDALLERAETYSREQRMQFVEAGVRKENTKARFSYKKRGYRREDTSTGDVLFVLEL